jgi:galactonate dehydratase
MAEVPVLDDREAGMSAEPAGWPRERIRITRIETFLVRPRWVFLKIHTDAGVAGWGEPVLEGRALTTQQAVREIEPYLIGKDPRAVAHHWQAIYRQAFYRGDGVLTSALSGIDMALWDIKGRLLGVPVFELLGGPTRSRVRVYAHVRDAGAVRAQKARGFTAFKTGLLSDRPLRFVDTPAKMDEILGRIRGIRHEVGPDCELALDFHGAASPAIARVFLRELEAVRPMFVEEPCLPGNVDVLAEIAQSTPIPIATGERVFTKWGFREILEKHAAAILQPDLCHAGGITETRLIAGMAEAYYTAIAPHNPLGPISLAAGVQLAAAIPNFLIQEQVTLGDGFLRRSFDLREGYIDVPAGPGLGIEVDEEAIAALPGHDWKAPEVYDPADGSVQEYAGGFRPWQ